MASPPDIEIKSYLQWSVVMPRHKLVSPVLKIQDLKCRLQIAKLHENCYGVNHYSIVVKKLETSKMFPYHVLKKTGTCRETFPICSFTPVKWHSGKSCYTFLENPNIPVTFIVQFEFDVNPNSAISEADKKQAQLASDSIQTRCLKTLSRDFSKLLEDSSNHDVVLRCQDSTVKAHRIVLMSRSTVFEGMLRSDMIEGQTGQVEVKDMDAEVFSDLVKYLYTGTLTKLSEDRAKSLYEAGDRYAVESLMQRCSAFLIENLTNENACDILEVAETHYDSVFKDMVIGYILKNKIPLMDEVWKPFSARCPMIAVDVLNRFIKLQAMA